MFHGLIVITPENFQKNIIFNQTENLCFLNDTSWFTVVNE
jgi:hypothetical protein